MNSITYLAHSVDQALRGAPHNTGPSLVSPPTLNEDLNVLPVSERSTINDIQLQLTPNKLDDDTLVDHEVSQTSGFSELKIDKPRATLKQRPQQHDQIPQQSLVQKILSVILFIPNLILVRPLLFIWYVFTFPLTLLERQRSIKPHKEPTQEEEQHEKTKFESGTSTSSVRQESNLTSSTILELDEDAEDTELRKPMTPNAEEYKSPSSNKLTKTSKFQFPKFVFPMNVSRKTLVLDLDETLVHSISRSTRSTKNGHMIEVKLSQVATLYYVHKRPYCDLFLQRVSKWFDVVIFTASVKEYADPVIDWLETERKYFSKRFYRNDCTLRDGEGYIKDLEAVDPNLNKVIIIDNSPISYALHENNAILVEGWINDDSDQDLLNLLPLLEALKYTNDVRPLLSLKNGAISFEK